MNDNCDGYKPYIRIQCCSVETNFGKDLKAKPFAFDFSKHKFHKYSDFGKLYLNNYKKVDHNYVPRLKY